MELISVLIALVALAISYASWLIHRDRRHEEIRPRFGVDTIVEVSQRSGIRILKGWWLTVSNDGPHDLVSVRWRLIGCEHGSNPVEGLVAQGGIDTQGDFGSMEVGDVVRYQFELLPGNTDGSHVSAHARLLLHTRRRWRFFDEWRLAEDFKFQDIPSAVAAKCPRDHTVTIHVRDQQLVAGSDKQLVAECPECGEEATGRAHWDPDKSNKA